MGIMTKDSARNYTLKEISEWGNDDSEVVIPSIQRGLVWRPKQVELIWDSILRNFPIGSFMLADEINNKYNLLDGQQRFNAIQLGFMNSFEHDIKSILWVDLLGKEEKNSTRKFWIRVTNLSHPWGFSAADDCHVLSAEDRRLAQELFFNKGNKFNNKSFYNIPLDKRFEYMQSCWPYISNEKSLLIPLYMLMKNADKNEEDFINSVFKEIQKFGNNHHEWENHFLKPFSDCDINLKQIIKNFYEPIHQTTTYYITANRLTNEVIEKESASGSDDSTQTPLEILFTRLNTGGTQISQADLLYSAIKVYFSFLKEKNDKLAEKIMPPAQLAMLVLRLYLTKEDDVNFHGILSISQIRNRAKDLKKELEEFYTEKLPSILTTINGWFDGNGHDDDSIPVYLRCGIVYNSPDIYLLLMWFAQKKEQCELNREEVLALVFLIDWYANNKAECIAKIRNRNFKEIKRENVVAALVDCLRDEYLQPIWTCSDIEEAINTDTMNQHWTFWNNINKKYYNFIINTLNNKEMLLFTERKFLNEKFGSYNPADSSLWSDYNRPWDYDHIFAQSWIVGKHGNWRDFLKEWIDTNGNFAAIPFEENRSKNDSAEYTFYKAYCTDLLVDLDGINKIINNDKFCNDLTNDQSNAMHAMQVIWERNLEIYSKCYDMLKIILDPTEPITDKNKDVFNRKNIMNRFCKLLQEIGHYKIVKQYVVPGFEINSDIKQDNEIDWCYQWISAGIEFSDGYQIALSSNDEEYELGIRKDPEKYTFNKAYEAKIKQFCEKDDIRFKYYEGDPWWVAYYGNDDTALGKYEDILSMFQNKEEFIETIKKLTRCFE